MGLGLRETGLGFRVSLGLRALGLGFGVADGCWVTSDKWLVTYCLRSGAIEKDHLMHEPWS